MTSRGVRWWLVNPAAVLCYLLAVGDVAGVIIQHVF